MNETKQEQMLELLHRDVKSLKEHIDVKFTEMDKRVASKEDIGLIRKETAEVKSGIIKWMFGFWLGQFTVTFGFVLLFLRK